MDSIQAISSRMSARDSCLPVSNGEARGRRIALMLILIWIIGLCDLGFTIVARQLGGFHESNPVAAKMVDASGLLTIFKLSLLVVASVIFLKFRRHWFTELGCWAMCLVHLALAVVWLYYYYGLS